MPKANRAAISLKNGEFAVETKTKFKSRDDQGDKFSPYPWVF